MGFPALIAAVWRLVRPVNLLLVAVTFLVIYFGIVVPVLDDSGLAPTLSPVALGCLLLSLVSLTASGYVINDLSDQKADRINRGDRMIVGNHLPAWQARALYTLGLFLAVVSALVAAVLTQRIYDLWLLVLVGVGLHGYSTRWKSTGLPGNLLIALFCAGVVALPVYAELGNWLKALSQPSPFSLQHRTLFWGYVFFAFQTTLIRELIKDLQDREGDREQGYQTLPLRVGEKRMQLFLLILIGILLGGLVFFTLALKLNGLEVLLGLLLVGIPLILLGIYLIAGGSKAHYAALSTLMKIIMGGGLTFLILLLLM
jgi:4-hydroxybenzoate polyprenyltransferase